MDVTGVVRTSADGRGQLASAIVSAREQLGVTQEEFAAHAGLSLKTVQRVELGRVTPTAKTFNGLDRGAKWSPGRARRLYDGIADVSVEDGSPVSGGSASPSAARQRILALTDVQLAERIVEIAEVQGVEAAGEYLAKVREIRQDAERAAAQRS